MAHPGATTPVQDINVGEEAHRIAEKIRPAVEAKIGAKALWQPVQYATQLVNGVNYFIKVLVTEHEAIFIRVWKGFQDADLSSLQLHSVVEGKRPGDPITYF